MLGALPAAPAPPPSTVATPAASAPAAAVFPREITDGSGRKVLLPAAPHRIVSLSPAITELVLAVGGGAELVGVTRYCTVPEREPPIARVGGVLDPDYERIVALHPELVLIPNLADGQMLNRLQSLGLRVVVFYPEGLDNFVRDADLAGRALAHEATAEALTRQFTTERALVHARLASPSPAARPTAALLYGGDLLAPGPAGFAGQLLDEAGARNVVPAAAKAWLQLTPESLLQYNPDFIFLVRESLAAWPPATQPALRNLAAVRAGRVIELPENLFEHPGPTQGEALWRLARALHPERFPEVAPPVEPSPPRSP